LKVQCIHGVDGLTEDEVCRTFTCSQTSSSPGPKSKPCAWDEKKSYTQNLKPCAWNSKTLPKGFEITGSWERKKKELTILSPMLG
jgi:hypothetical protein